MNIIQKSEQANRQTKERVKKEEKVSTRATPADAPIKETHYN